MDKEMYGVKVYTSDSGNIVISQPSEMGDESRVVIHRDQVDTLVKWLNQEKYEMEENSNNNNYYGIDAPF